MAFQAMIVGADDQRRVRCGKTNFRQVDNRLILCQEMPGSAHWFSQISPVAGPEASSATA